MLAGEVAGGDAAQLRSCRCGRRRCTGTEGRSPARKTAASGVAVLWGGAAATEAAVRAALVLSCRAAFQGTLAKPQPRAVPCYGAAMPSRSPGRPIRVGVAAPRMILQTSMHVSASPARPPCSSAFAGFVWDADRCCSRSCNRAKRPAEKGSVFDRPGG